MTRTTPRQITERLHSNVAASRRAFSKQVVAAAASFSIVPRHVLGGHPHTAPSDSYKIFILVIVT